jgi:hypothetical protein
MFSICKKFTIKKYIKTIQREKLLTKKSAKTFPMEAIIIENKEIVDANKKYFKILWKQAEKIEK